MAWMTLLFLLLLELDLKPAKSWALGRVPENCNFAEYYVLFTPNFDLSVSLLSRLLFLLLHLLLALALYPAPSSQSQCLPMDAGCFIIWAYLIFSRFQPCFQHMMYYWLTENFCFFAEFLSPLSLVLFVWLIYSLFLREILWKTLKRNFSNFFPFFDRFWIINLIVINNKKAQTDWLLANNLKKVGW